ncbi:hypothetical protein MYOV003v1_p0044 [Vibrio phage 207E48.1]|nr:hypothetical protein MYOV003v1_p0044 [Vibrio phage 207E48.1]
MKIETLFVPHDFAELLQAVTESFEFVYNMKPLAGCITTDGDGCTWVHVTDHPSELKFVVYLDNQWVCQDDFDGCTELLEIVMNTTRKPQDTKLYFTMIDGVLAFHTELPNLG